MTNGLVIRRATGSDCDDLTRIAHAAKRHWRYPEEHIRLWRDDLTITPSLLQRLDVFCAVANGRIAGFYAVETDGEDRDLEHMWVDPSAMRRGVGRALLTHAREALRAAGCATLRIESDPHAEDFYLAMGARRVGEVPSRVPGRALPVLVIDLR